MPAKITPTSLDRAPMETAEPLSERFVFNSVVATVLVTTIPELPPVIVG